MHMATVEAEGGRLFVLPGSNQKTPYRAALDSGYIDVATQIKLLGGGDSCRQ